MKTSEAYAAAAQFGPEAAFVANLIATREPRAAAKLRGLVALLRAGHDVRTAQFDADVLIIDGRKMAWPVLESPALVPRWLGVAEKA